MLRADMAVVAGTRRRRRIGGVRMIVVLFSLLLTLAPVVPMTASASGGELMAQPIADASPSPDSTASAAPNPPGAADGDPDDFNGAPWIVVGVAVAFVLIIGWTLFTATTRRTKSSKDRPHP